MFLSNFSIKQPVTTVAIVIVLMCLGLLALKNLRVNQIPDVEQPVMVVNVPYPGASPETVEREIINRVEKSLQSIPQVYEIRSTASESHAQHRHHLQLQEGHDRGRRRDPQRHRVGALQAADRDARAGAVPRRSVGAADHAAGAVVDEADARRDLAPGRRRARRPLPRASTAWPWSTSTARCSASCRCCCTRRSCASTTSRSREVVNALRAQNTTAPVGRVKGALDEQSIRLVGRIESPREFDDIVVKRQRQRDRAPRARWPPSRTASPSSRSYSLRNGAAERRPRRSSRSREASTVTVAEQRARRWSTEINKTLPDGHQARGHAGRRRGRRRTA